MDPRENGRQNSREITRRETLLECLDMMKRIRNAFSRDQLGLQAEEKFEALFAEYDEKCRILREIIQANESEPVRRALADWQKEILDRGTEPCLKIT